MVFVCVINTYILPKGNIHLQPFVSRQMQNIFILVILKSPQNKAQGRSVAMALAALISNFF